MSSGIQRGNIREKTRRDRPMTNRSSRGRKSSKREELNEKNSTYSDYMMYQMMLCTVVFIFIVFATVFQTSLSRSVKVQVGKAIQNNNTPTQMMKQVTGVWGYVSKKFPKISTK